MINWIEGQGKQGRREEWREGRWEGRREGKGI